MARTQPIDSSLAPKDDVELQLERLVFGDEDAFRDELQRHAVDSDGEQPSRSRHTDVRIKERGLEAYQDLEALDDSQLFFFDAAPRPGMPLVSTDASADIIPKGTGPSQAAVWVDSDDERISVSLATSGRLRKLRQSEDEDVVRGAEYIQRLQQQYEKLHPPPEWATYLTQSANGRKRRRLSGSSSGSGDMDSDEQGEDDLVTTQPLSQLLQGASPLVHSSARKVNGLVAFRAETLNIQRTKDVSNARSDVVNSLSFHPTLPLLLSSGPLGSAGQVTLHHIAPAAPIPNPQLTRLSLRQLRTYASSFHPSGTKVILTARRRYYHIWDLESGRFYLSANHSRLDSRQESFDQFAPSPCGRFLAFIGSGKTGEGFVNVVDAETGQWLCSGQVEGNGGAADLAWWQNGDGLCILGKGGEVLEYSVRERRPLARWTDEGAIGATKIALGAPLPGKKQLGGLGGNRFVAVGSSSGIVNIYDRSAWTDRGGPGAIPERPSPKRTFDQLITSISTLRFSPDGQLLAMGSQEKRDALRIIHVPSCTVYRNWPTSDTPLGRISSLAWGQIGDEGELALAIANDRGQIRLWQVRG